MKKVAALSASQRQELFALTAERLGMGSPAIVEKDFWVCWALKQTFSHPGLKDKMLFILYGFNGCRIECLKELLN